MKTLSFDTHLKPGILLFWSLWLSVVTATNLADGLKSLGVLPATFAFASGNVQFMRQVTATLHTPPAMVAILFAGVVAWELFATALHWTAFAGWRTHTADAGARVQRAFVVSTALWCAFLVADEIFISYDVEATHFRLLIAALVSVLLFMPTIARTDA